MVPPDEKKHPARQVDKSARGGSLAGMKVIAPGIRRAHEHHDAHANTHSDGAANFLAA
jgi:hypothetical protein